MRKLLLLFILALASCRPSALEESVEVPETTETAVYDWTTDEAYNAWDLDTLAASQEAADFKTEDYLYSPTPYGVLYYKIGPRKQAQFSHEPTMTFDYYAGVEPDFKWFDAKTQAFQPVSQLEFLLGEEEFEAIHVVYFSTSERKLLIEVGLFNVNSEAFQPGIAGPQPDQSRGLVYDIDTHTFSESSEFATYLNALDAKTSLLGGYGLNFIWDSAAHWAVSVPGGEGCGSYDSLTFVDLKSGASIVEGGKNNTDFASGICNPRNGFTVDHQWVYLYGQNPEGELEFHIYSLDHSIEKVKVLPYEATDAYMHITAWDLTRPLPIFRIGDSLVVDFNE